MWGNQQRLHKIDVNGRLKLVPPGQHPTNIKPAA